MNNPKKYIHQDLLMNLISLAVALFFFIGSFFITRTKNPTANINTYPFLISLLLLICSILSLPASIRATRELNEKIGRGEDMTRQISWQELKYPMTGALFILIYIICVCTIGFFVSSAVFLILMPFYLGYRKLHVLVPTAAGILIFIYILFVKILFTKLPAGLLF